MHTVQLAIKNSDYRAALERALGEAGAWQAVCVADPDLAGGGVIVLDAQALDSLGGLLKRPERVVLITQKDPQHLARAWDAGIISVVFEEDPVSMAMLAIMSAALRDPQPAAEVLHRPEPAGTTRRAACQCHIRPTDAN